MLNDLKNFKSSQNIYFSFYFFLNQHSFLVSILGLLSLLLLLVLLGEAVVLKLLALQTKVHWLSIVHIVFSSRL